jgi:hypothetical protein
VAIVDHQPFRVSYAFGSGVLRVGPPIMYRKQVVNDSVKRAYLAERAETTTGIVVGRDGSVSRTRGSPPSGGPTIWVDEVPAYRPRAFLSFDPNGILWIQRTTFGREGGRYDLIGQEGKLIDRLRLPEGHRVVGFGRNAMYVVRRATDDTEYVQLWLPPRS